MRSGATPELAIVLVSFRSRERVLDALALLMRDPSSERWEITVVDNASDDGTVSALTTAFPRVRVIANDRNRGFAAAVNQGVAATTAPFIALHSGAERAGPGTYDRLAAVLSSDPRIAAVAPLVLNPDGSPQRHGLFRPRPRTAFVVLMGLARIPFLRREAERYYGPHEPGPPIDVEQVSGASMVLRRAAFDSIGPLDESFFMYCEDVDWCLRAKAAGWRIVFVPSVEVRREKSISSRRASGATIRLYYRSLRRFYSKHHRRSPAPVRALYLMLGWAMEQRALAINALRREKGLRY